MDPVSRLKLRSRRLKLGRKCRDFGRFPERELREKSKDWRDLRFEMEGGMDPEKELDRRERIWRLGREEKIEEGMVPEKELSERSRMVKWERRERREERVPE